ncbi:MAG TPA: alpha-amylase family glycosyl hydrolase [Candidatus Binataceae bacterium]|nr:alpha-amylase family glycosyl hydrolase [Candidatus Binataceae bacterium]
MDIDVLEVGAFPLVTAGGGFQIRFGLYLPGIRAADGFEVVVRLIKKEDRFDPAIQPQDSQLTWNAGHALDLWSTTINVAPVAGSNFGYGRNLSIPFPTLVDAARRCAPAYHPWFTDPFARQTEVGLLSAVTLSRNPLPFGWTDALYKTPDLDDLIVYELHVEQFNDTFDGVIDRLTYLQSLGVNCLELMPVTSPKLDFDWDYGPLHYFSPSAHFGGPDGLRRLVDACHHSGIAVILDVVYQHVDPAFAYKLVYDNVNNTPGPPNANSPMIGANGPFGPQCDFGQVFTQQYFAASNRQWLDQYHVDGFRYDEVTDLYVGPTDSGYAKLAYDTYRYSLNFPRFQREAGGYSRIIQCAEALWRAPDVLSNTYTSCAWQNDLLDGAEAIAGGSAPTDDFAHVLDPFFSNRYPATKSVVNAAGQAVDMPVAPFQYLNSHDHSHLIVFAGTTGSGPFPAGDRSRFWRLQPLAIALYTSQGVPMLWEGEEFADDYNLPDQGSARVNLRRDTHWEYFYDDYGVPLIRLYRRLAQLRHSRRALRSRDSFYYWQQSLQSSSQLVAYHRHAPAGPDGAEEYAMVILNFASNADTIAVPFPKGGTWMEELDADVRVNPWAVQVASDGAVQRITVPSNYGCIFIL